MKLPEIKLSADSMIEGKFYIWDSTFEKRIVQLDRVGEHQGLGAQGEDDMWYFADDLIGKLYGPFEI